VAFNPPIVDNEIPSAAKWNTAVGMYDRSTVIVDIVSTAVETDAYSKVITGGHMSTDRALRVTFLGDYLNNTGGVATFTLRIKLGGTLYGQAIGSIAASATRRPYWLEFLIANIGTGIDQITVGVHSGLQVAPSTASVAGVWGGLDLTSFSTAGSTAVDTTINQTLAITGQHGASSANLSFRKRYVAVELL
jgi:hypothetical protein